MTHFGRLARLATITGLFLFGIILSLPQVVAAGQGAAAPASIIGQITDGTGGILPGVTVTATSPALQVPSVTTVSDERGDYRLSPLPIGTYAVVYELAGFQVVRREGVRLTVGFAARVDMVMNVGAVSETITVSGASPLVDTTSTATTTELTREQLDVLPTNRDGLKAFLGQVPGARTNLEVGMSGLSDGVGWRIYGQVGEQWHMIEGVLGTTGGAHFDFNSIEGTRVQSVGANAEMPRRGMLVDAVVKSGGNEFHGNAIAYGTTKRFESSNIDDTLRDAGIRGAADLHHQVDLSGGIGGRIIRNKLWFFGAGSIKSYDRDVLDAFEADGTTPIVLTTDMHYHTEKVSYQASPSNRFAGFYHKAQDTQVRDASRFVPGESRIRADNPVDVGKVEWQGVRGNSLVTSIQHGFFDYAAIYDSVDPTKLATTDIATQYVTGAHTNDGRRNLEFRHHTKGVVSWFKSDLLAGNHEFKGGFDYLFSWRSERFLSRQAGNYQLQFNNGAPFQIATYNYPVTPRNDDRYIGLYVQDAWTIARRLTLNLGLRYARDNAYAPAQCREAGDFAAAACFDKVQMVVWNSVAPRVHAALDLLGDGKTVVKGGWGRFDHLREIVPELMPTNRNNPQTTTWTWRDTNGNRNYDAGEVDLNPNGRDFQGLAGATDAIPNPNELMPKTDEFSVTLERELMANWAVRATGIYSRNFNVYRTLEINRPDSVYNIPITNLDPGPDGRLGTGDDTGNAITYYDYPAALRGRAFAGTMLVNDDRADQSFKTIEVAGQKRLSQGWQVFAAFSATLTDIPFTCGNNNAQVTRCPLNPNAEIFTANNTWERTGKLSGAYTFPLDIAGSVNYEYRSGAPQARQVLFRGGQAIASLVVNVEPIGSIALPNTHMVDLRASKRLALGGGRTMELRMDVFNAFNSNATLVRVIRSGSEYLKPGVPFTGQLSVVQATVLPRIIQFGASFAF